MQNKLLSYTVFLYILFTRIKKKKKADYQLLSTFLECKSVLGKHFRMFTKTIHNQVYKS